MSPRMSPTVTGENEGKLWDVAEQVGSAAPAVESLTSATFFSKKRWNSPAEIRLSAGVRHRRTDGDYPLLQIMQGRLHSTEYRGHPESFEVDQIRKRNFL